MLGLALLCAGAASAGTSVVLQPLLGEAGLDEILSGRADDRLGPPQAPVIRGRKGQVSWWRITTAGALGAEGSPKIVLRSPYLNRVQAWVPGGAGPSGHAVYGEDADYRYSHRALVIDLPEGIPAGTAAWLRVETDSALQMPVSIESLGQVHREDLVFVAWRVFVLSVLAVLAALAIAFRFGTGEASFGWFGAMLFFAMLYITTIGGDVRVLPWADELFGSSNRANRIAGGLGVLASNLFQRSYLDLANRLPRLDRVLWVGNALAILTGAGSLVSDGRWLGWTGNIALVLSAMVLLLGSALLALRGDRAGRVVVASWLPLMLFTTLMATEMMGLWAGPTWLPQGLAGSFAMAGLLLAIGLADKLLELRRDRDHASARARADDLTGALNRVGVEAELRQAVAGAGARGTPMCIAFVDLDDFKAINDRHGHSVGDHCLRIVAQRARNQLRGGDVFGRYGGDEFLVVMPDTRLDDAMGVARRVLATVNSRPLTVQDLRLQATLSIGVAELHQGESTEALFERADAALYASKQAGRNRVTGARGHGWEPATA